VILVDAGPLVAILNARERRHAECRDFLMHCRDDLATVWPALTEAMYLLGNPVAQDALWDLVCRSVLVVLPLDAADAPRMRQLMHKYRDLPMDLADAALVCVAERERVSRILTLDQRDFHTYRLEGKGRFTVLP
jgi:predicted nucleic acid-binding protein